MDLYLCQKLKNINIIFILIAAVQKISDQYWTKTRINNLISNFDWTLKFLVFALLILISNWVGEINFNGFKLAISDCLFGCKSTFIEINVQNIIWEENDF